ncbi:hypothetical protein COL922a_013411, partial [Colletotrichum nupharicola]
SLLTASPTPPALPAPDEISLSRRAGQCPDFPSDYEGRVKKGEYLWALMPLDNAQAAQANGGASVVSPFQDPNAAARNVVNPSAGAFIFDENMSPRYVVKEYGLGTVPDMDTLSDFAFFEWLEGCQYKNLDPKDL